MLDVLTVSGRVLKTLIDSYSKPLKYSDFRGRLNVKPSPFYNSVGRLIDEGLIIKGSDNSYRITQLGVSRYFKSVLGGWLGTTYFDEVMKSYGIGLLPSVRLALRSGVVLLSLFSKLPEGVREMIKEYDPELYGYLLSKAFTI